MQTHRSVTFYATHSLNTTAQKTPRRAHIQECHTKPTEAFPHIRKLPHTHTHQGGARSALNSRRQHSPNRLTTTNDNRPTFLSLLTHITELFWLLGQLPILPTYTADLHLKPVNPLKETEHHINRLHHKCTDHSRALPAAAIIHKSGAETSSSSRTTPTHTY